MKLIKWNLLAMTIVSMFFSCSKPEEEAETCEDTNTTNVTFSNTTSAARRVVVSARLTPQYEPVDVLFTIDLAAGQSTPKEFQAGRYVTTWYTGCPTACNRTGFFFRDFDQCNQYEEKQ